MNTTTTKHYDLVIIGAGPTGLAAALYAAREGIKTLILEKSVVGGMAAITALVDNYPGFDQGVGGLELADHLYAHATRFGAEVQTGVEVTALRPTRAQINIDTTSGQFTAGSVLVATGSNYKKLDIPGEAEMIGRGVHFCATCDAPLYRGRDLLVIGGGNSAVQESLFIAKFAKHVTLLVRGPELKGTEVLREQLTTLRNVSFRFNTKVTDIRNDGSKVTGVHIADTETDEEFDIRTDGIFVFVGLSANTKPFAGTLDLDAQGFIRTEPDFTTKVPGIYSAGDVRSGSTWQIASAIGEGVSAALEIRKYLDQLRHEERAAKKVAPRAPMKARSTKA